jgi:sugar lactone lactonase YvrE
MFTLPDLVTSVSLRVGGGLLLSLRKTLAFYDPDTGHLEVLADREPDRPGNRFNDARCDPRGRLWAGTRAPTIGWHRLGPFSDSIPINGCA